MITVQFMGYTQDSNDPYFQIKTELGFMIGCYHENEIWIWSVHTTWKGAFRQFMNAVVNRFNCNNIRFTTVLNDKLFSLRGFHKEKVWHPEMREMDEHAVGKWELLSKLDWGDREVTN